jgi:hypothetical protein
MEGVGVADGLFGGQTGSGKSFGDLAANLGMTSNHQDSAHIALRQDDEMILDHPSA